MAPKNVVKIEDMGTEYRKIKHAIMMKLAVATKENAQRVYNEVTAALIKSWKSHTHPWRAGRPQYWTTNL